MQEGHYPIHPMLQDPNKSSAPPHGRCYCPGRPWLSNHFHSPAEGTKIQNGKFCKEMSPTNIHPKTNITPENRPSQKESSLPNTNFQVRHVSFRVWNIPISSILNFDLRHRDIQAPGVSLLHSDLQGPRISQSFFGELFGMIAKCKCFGDESLKLVLLFFWEGGWGKGGNNTHANSSRTLNMRGLWNVRTNLGSINGEWAQAGP